MQTIWNYTKLADAYIKRPEYSSQAIDEMCSFMGVGQDSKVCDIGAGVGHLTVELAKRQVSHIHAMEPNDAMRKNGIEKTKQFKNVTWFKGTAEETNQKDDFFDAVTFGSSFNVCDQKLALQECLRIIKPRGWFACMWNHRDLEDPIQKNIEKIIQKNLPSYNYGLRREDQKPILEASGLFEEVKFLSGKTVHSQSIADCIEAWRSHGTLHREANQDDELFGNIIEEIEAYLMSLKVDKINIPYVTRIWTTRFKKK